MSTFFGCSQSSMYAHLRRLGMGQRSQFSILSTEELDCVVSDIHSRHPNAGANVVDVARNWSLESLHVILALDYSKNMRPTLLCVTPRVMTSYLLAEGKRVQRQLVRDSLLRVHMDGHMKLIRWGITTHGCIDGFSRLIVFLKASTNNKASTVFSTFLRATLAFGLPSMVRSDHGGENKHVALFFNIERGMNRYISGMSVHNQRIERLWRCAHQGDRNIL